MPSSEVMGKWGSGKLKSGGSGRTVPHTKAGQKVAEAIMFSERRNEDETGSPDTPKRGKKPARRPSTNEP